MIVEHCAEHCGTVVAGIQLARATHEQIIALRALLFDRGVVFFREQELTEDDHLRFARDFGEIVINQFFGTVAGYPEIAEVRKEPQQTMNIGGGWHTDHSYDAAPALGSILVARELPDSGGDTLFVNMQASCAALPQSLRQRIIGLSAIHSNEHIYGEGGYYASTDLAPQLGGSEKVGSAIHPVLINHPDTGAEILYVNPGHTVGLENIEHKTAFALLNQLYEHSQQPQFQCRFAWQPGSVAIWDNRLTWHLAENDYHGQRRLMHRVTIGGPHLSRAA
jgi:taurine dioxygenase